MNKKGFTIFELLAGLTIISIALAVALGSYSSWATVYALDSAAQTLETGLLHARSIAKSKSTYVKFFYGTEGTAPNSVKLISGYQSFVCTNDTDRSIISEVLLDCSTMDGGGAGDITDSSSLFSKQFAPLMSAQRLTGHIVLGYVEEARFSQTPTDTVEPYADGCTLIFCPDGSAWSWNDPSSHNILISTRKRFMRTDQAQPMQRIVRVNLSTGTTTTYRPEQLKGGT